MRTRYLGVDLGTKRIGLALGEPAGPVVSPLQAIDARSGTADNARAILEVAQDYDVGGIVIGLPLNMNGTEGPQAKLSRSLAEAIRRMVGFSKGGGPRGGEGGAPPAVEVYLHDERLTSHAADQLLAERELTDKQKKARQDAVAAQILLQSFLESRGAGHA